MQIDFNPPPRSGISKSVHTVVVIGNIFIVFLVFLLIGIRCKRGYSRSKTKMERGIHIKTILNKLIILLLSD